MIASLIFLSVQLIQKQCLHEEVLGLYPAPSSSLQSLLKDKKDLISHLLMPGKNWNLEISFATLQDLKFHTFMSFQILKMLLYLWNAQVDLSTFHTGIRLGLNFWRQPQLRLRYQVHTSSLCLVCMCDVPYWSQSSPASSDASSLHCSLLNNRQILRGLNPDSDSQSFLWGPSHLNVIMKHDKI